MRFLRNDEDARDALQDTFFKLWQNGPVETDTEARNKLFTVLRNICIDRLRRPVPGSLTEAEPDGMTGQPDVTEDMDRMESLLTSGLTDTQRHIYTLVARDGMEYEDIASALDMKVEAVRMNMSRARKKIKENYQKLNR